MREEFNLSEKIKFINDYDLKNEKDVHPAVVQRVIQIEDVEEFIKLLKEEFNLSEKIVYAVHKGE